MTEDDDDRDSIGDGLGNAGMWIALAVMVWALAWCTVKQG